MCQARQQEFLEQRGRNTLLTLTLQDMKKKEAEEEEARRQKAEQVCQAREQEFLEHRGKKTLWNTFITGESAMGAAPAEASATSLKVENTFFTIKEECAAPVEQRSHSAPARLRSIKEQDAALPVEHHCSAAAADAHEQTLRIAGVEQYLWRGGAWRDATGKFVSRKKKWNRQD